MMGKKLGEDEREGITDNRTEETGVMNALHKTRVCSHIRDGSALEWNYGYLAGSTGVIPHPQRAHKCC